MDTAKRIIMIIVLYLIAAALLYGCSERQGQPDVQSSEQLNEHTYNETTTGGIVDSSTVETQTINLFEGVGFVFSGWDGHGTLTIEEKDCSQFVKDNVDFQIEYYTNGELSNGVPVTIRAIYDSALFESQNYAVETDTMTVTVLGLSELISASDYSEEKAWIQYAKNENSYLACIDKTGKILFQFDNGLSLNAELFSNGYAHVTDVDGNMYVVDSNGKVTSMYPVDSPCEVIAYGGGYTLTKEHVASFSETYDMYYFDNYDGSINEVWTHEEDAVRSAKYCGAGVFAIDIRYGSDVWYYCARNGTWVENIVDGSMDCVFYTNIAWVYSQSFDDALIYLTSDGEIVKIMLPTDTGIDWNWFRECYVRDGVCFTWNESLLDPYMLSYDFVTDTYAFLDEKYLSRVDWDALHEGAAFDDGYIYIPMIGSDGKPYYAIFDKLWNEIVEPTVYSSLIGFSDGRLIVRQNSDTYIYNYTGDLIFTLSEKNIPSISPYSNRVAHTSFFYYVDVNGDILFENINTEGITTNVINAIS